MKGTMNESIMDKTKVPVMYNKRRPPKLMESLDATINKIMEAINKEHRCKDEEARRTRQRLYPLEGKAANT